MSGNNTNIVVLTGRLGREPQVINANTKVPFAILNLAINKKWKKDGNSHERTNWIKIKLNNTNVTQYLNKGDPVAITGELISSSREIEGKKRTSFYVKAKTVELLKSKQVTEKKAVPSSTTMHDNDEFDGFDDEMSC